MSGRIRLDGAGPGATDNPQPTNTESEDRERRPQEPAGEQSERPAPAAPPDPEYTPQPPAGGAAGEQSEQPSEEERNGRDQKRIDQLTRERYEARRERDEARAQLNEWQQQQRRQQQPSPDQAAEDRAYNRMQQERIEQDFNRECNELWQRGVDEYGQEMHDAKRGLDAVGWGNRPDALAALTALPDGHRVYRELAGDLDNAARILSLPPMRMAVELARMSRGEQGERDVLPQGANRDQTESRRSRAPAPLRPVGGNSARADAPLDQVSMAEFIRRRDREERGSRIRR